jgi:predicted ArsR family transcriptional regulator
MQTNSPEFRTFTKAMDEILKADPQAIREAMDTEKREREEAQRRTGKRGRGRPAKHPRVSSSRASSGKD